MTLVSWDATWRCARKIPCIFPSSKNDPSISQDRLGSNIMRKRQAINLNFKNGVLRMQADLAPATKREMVDWAKAELIYAGKQKKSNSNSKSTLHVHF